LIPRSRLFKEVTEEQISQLEEVNHKLRGQNWRKANRAGVSKVGLNPVQRIDIDSAVDSVCGTQEGAAKGYNPRKMAHSPTILNWHSWWVAKKSCKAWFRTGSSYTSNGVDEFVKQLLAHSSKGAIKSAV